MGAVMTIRNPQSDSRLFHGCGSAPSCRHAFYGNPHSSIGIGRRSLPSPAPEEPIVQTTKQGLHGIDATAEKMSVYSSDRGSYCAAEVAAKSITSATICVVGLKATAYPSL